MRALFAVLAVALVLAACSDVPTNPSALPTDLTLANQLYCPGPFTLVGSKGHEEVDNNGDFQVCQLEILLDDKVTVATTFVDNNVPHDVGACPKGFTPRSVRVVGEGADHNADGWECVATRPNGNVVVIDNRFDVEDGGIKPEEPKEETK
ncbi:MAG TPA: hypothetical protein VIQ27_10310 [Gemmatimonadales bacterium]|jgi:hypothetical protein